MLVQNHEFVENYNYAYAVGLVRALETKLLDETAYSSLLSTRIERFIPLFLEITGVKGGEKKDPILILDTLEESYNQSFTRIRSLIIEDEMKRLVSLRYDYDILKIILKEGRVPEIRVSVNLLERSNYGFGKLKSLLTGGRELETGEILFRTYKALIEKRDAGGREIDHICDCAYYKEVFRLLDACNNDFIRNYFIREIDALNILTSLRLKIQGKKRTVLRENYIPSGSIDLRYLEDGFEMNIDGFASLIQFSPMGVYLSGVDRSKDEEEQVAQLERLFDNALYLYLKESIFVTFGIEPLFTFLWLKERELKNLRTIFVGRITGVSPEEIKKYLR